MAWTHLDRLLRRCRRAVSPAPRRTNRRPRPVPLALEALERRELLSAVPIATTTSIQIPSGAHTAGEVFNITAVVSPNDPAVDSVVNTGNVDYRIDGIDKGLFPVGSGAANLLYTATAGQHTVVAT